MNLKNYLRDRKAQSIVEYIVMLTVITTVAIIAFFGVRKFQPASDEEGKRDNFFTGLKIKDAFDRAINSAKEELNKQ